MAGETRRGVSSAGGPLPNTPPSQPECVAQARGPTRDITAQSAARAPGARQLPFHGPITPAHTAAPVPRPTRRSVPATPGRRQHTTHPTLLRHSRGFRLFRSFQRVHTGQEELGVGLVELFRVLAGDLESKGTASLIQ